MRIAADYKKFASFLILIPAFLLSLATAKAGKFKVIHVYDGDTLKVSGHDIEVKIRLVGIDAPEVNRGKRKPGQPYSQQAKKYLAGMVLNKTVDLRGYGTDKYNRLLFEVFFDGKNVNLEMVKAGLAEVCRGKAPHGLVLEPYLQAEEKAKADKIGMWAQEKYISPKE